MGLDTVQGWKERAPGDMLDLIKNRLPPATWGECRNSRWEEVLTFYCEQTYSLENLTFLLAVSDYRNRPSVSRAEEIIEEIIYGNPPLNLYPESSSRIDDWYKDEDHELDVDLFKRAAAEVNEAFAGTYYAFLDHVRTARDGLLAEDRRR